MNVEVTDYFAALRNALKLVDRTGKDRSPRHGKAAEIREEELRYG